MGRFSASCVSVPLQTVLPDLSLLPQSVLGTLLSGLLVFLGMSEALV